MGRASWLAAVAGGAVFPLAFAPYGLWWCAYLALALLFHLFKGASARAAAVTGWWFGLGMFGHGVWWIQVSVHQFGVPYYAFSVSVTALFVAAMALYPALVGCLSRVLPADGEIVRGVVLAPALWVLAEWLRGFLFTGFPWLAAGYSQIDTPLAGIAPILGVYGCSAAIAVSAGIVAVVPALERRTGAMLGMSLLVLFGGAAVLQQRDWTAPAGEPLTAVLVQGAIPQAIKWRVEQRQPSLDLYQALSAPHWGVDIMIWPETAIAAFPFQVPEVIEALHGQAVRSGTDLLIGMPSGDPYGADYFNSVVDLGATPGRYDKRHRVPFGEYFPFKSLLERMARLLTIPMSDFAAGAAEQTPLQVAGYTAGVSICYEDAFPQEVAKALPQAAFLVNVSNDAWFGDTIAPHQHLEIARMRALESERYLLRSTNTGISALVDHNGAVLSRSPQFEPHGLAGAVVPRAGATPYTRFGNRPLIIALALAIGAAGLLSRRRWSRV